MVQVALALGQQGIHHLGGLGGCGQRQGLFPPGLQGDGQVLAVESNPEAGLEVAVENALAVQIEDAALGKAAQQGLAHPGRVHTGFAGQGHGLGHGLDGQGHHHLVAGLGDLPGPRPSDQDDVLAHHLEQGLGLMESLLRAAHHDREGAGLGPHVPPGNRCVQGLHPFLLEGLVDPPGGRRSDGGHVNEELAGAQAPDDSLRPQDHRLDVRGVWQHGDDHVALFGHFPGRGCLSGPFADQLIHRRPVDVVHYQ